jgi:hypothetical protein
MTYRYHAFISYSHQDTAIARRLHRALETLPPPKGVTTRTGEAPRRLYPIFRDDDELPTSADLGAQIRTALSESEYLIVLCSPAAATSRWVAEEILTFKRLGGENRILAVILDGEPHASRTAAGAARECFPEPLRYTVGEDGALTDTLVEPIAADLRPGRQRFEDVKLKVAAGLWGIGYEALRRRDAQRRKRRAMLAAAAGVAFIATVGLLSNLYVGASERAGAESYERGLAAARQLAVQGDFARAAATLAGVVDVGGETAAPARRVLATWLSALAPIDDVLDVVPPLTPFTLSDRRYLRDGEGGVYEFQATDAFALTDAENGLIFVGGRDQTLRLLDSRLNVVHRWTVEAFDFLPAGFGPFGTSYVFLGETRGTTVGSVRPVHFVVDVESGDSRRILDYQRWHDEQLSTDAACRAITFHDEDDRPMTAELAEAARPDGARPADTGPSGIDGFRTRGHACQARRLTGSPADPEAFPLRFTPREVPVAMLNSGVVLNRSSPAAGEAAGPEALGGGAMPVDRTTRARFQAIVDRATATREYPPHRLDPDDADHWLEPRGIWWPFDFSEPYSHALQLFVERTVSYGNMGSGFAVCRLDAALVFESCTGVPQVGDAMGIRRSSSGRYVYAPNYAFGADHRAFWVIDVPGQRVLEAAAGPTGHGPAPEVADFSPDERLLAMHTGGGALWLYEVDSTAPTTIRELPGSIGMEQWVPLASALTLIRQMPVGFCRWSEEQPGGQNPCVALLVPHAETVVLVRSDGAIAALDTESHAERWRHAASAPEPVTAASRSLDGAHLVLHTDSFVRVVDAGTGLPLTDYVRREDVPVRPTEGQAAFLELPDGLLLQRVAPALIDGEEILRRTGFAAGAPGAEPRLPFPTPSLPR